MRQELKGGRALSLGVQGRGSWAPCAFGEGGKDGKDTREGGVPDVVVGAQFNAVQRLVLQELGWTEDVSRRHPHIRVAAGHVREVRRYADLFRRTGEVRYALAALQVRG